MKQLLVCLLVIALLLPAVGWAGDPLDLRAAEWKADRSQGVDDPSLLPPEPEPEGGWWAQRTEFERFLMGVVGMFLLHEMTRSRGGSGGEDEVDTYCPPRHYPTPN